MNALNEVNKVISNVTYNIQLRASSSISSSSSSTHKQKTKSNLKKNKKNKKSKEVEWLTSERMAVIK
jgi:hypothetical protein